MHINVPINAVCFEFLFYNYYSSVFCIEHSIPCDFVSLFIFLLAVEDTAFDFRNSIFSFTEH